MLQRIYAVVVKEVRQIRRDRRTLGLLLFVPALMLVLYGYALTFDVKHIAIAVLDRDQSAESREFADGLFHSEYFDRVGTAAHEREADHWLDARRARAVLVIPRGFGEGIQRGEAVQVQALVDGANANSANVTIGNLQAKAREYTLGKIRVHAARAGLGSPPLPIAAEPRIWYNPTLESSQFLVPGLIGFLLMVVGAISTSLSVVREKERGTMEQIVVSAARPGEFIIGKALPYLCILLVTEALIIAASVLLFAMPLRGSLFWLLAASVVYLAGGLGYGLFVSTLADTQQVAFQIAALSTILPSMILSDLVFPIASMPVLLQWLTHVIPARHFIVIMRSVILKGTGAEAWTAELVILTAFAGLILVVASRRLARNMRRT